MNPKILSFSTVPLTGNL